MQGLVWKGDYIMWVVIMKWRRESPVHSVDMRYRDDDWPLRAAPEKCWSGVGSPGQRWWLWDKFVCCDDTWNILSGLVWRWNPIKPDKVWQALAGWLFTVPALTPSGVVPVQEPPRGTSSRNFPAFLLGPGIHLVVAPSSKYFSFSQQKCPDKDKGRGGERTKQTSRKLCSFVCPVSWYCSEEFQNELESYHQFSI